MRIISYLSPNAINQELQFSSKSTCYQVLNSSHNHILVQTSIISYHIQSLANITIYHNMHNSKALKHMASFTSNSYHKYTCNNTYFKLNFHAHIRNMLKIRIVSHANFRMQIQIKQKSWNHFQMIVQERHLFLDQTLENLFKYGTS